MASESWTEVWIAIAAFVLLAVAAGLEAAIGVVGRERLRELADGPGGRRRTIEELLAPRRALSAALFLLQALALAVAAAVLTSMFAREVAWGEHVLAVAVVLVAYVVLGIGLPGALRRYRRDGTPAMLEWLAGVLTTIARPLIVVGEWLTAGFARLLPAPREGAAGEVGFEEELAPLFGVEAATGPIEPAERAMIQGVLDLEELRVHEIMVPRVDIVAVEVGTSVEELVETIVRAGHSRIPVYEESIDHIVGVLYVKDLIPFVPKEPTELPLADLVRPAYVVPESKRVDALLLEMRRARVHMAIVADEYGGTAGLVTIEDILEEIVGEIHDEFDIATPPLLERIGEHAVVADARLAIAELEEALGVRFPEDADFDTLGGYVQTALGRLPREGDRFVDREIGVDVAILTVEGRRARRVEVVRLVEAGEEPESMTDGWRDATGPVAADHREERAPSRIGPPDADVGREEG